MMSTFFADVAFTYILIRFFSVIYNLLLFLVNRFCLLFFTEIIVDKHGVKIVSQTIDKKYILNRLLQMNNAFISCKYINSEPYVIAKMQRIIYNIRCKGGLFICPKTICRKLKIESCLPKMAQFFPLLILRILLIPTRFVQHYTALLKIIFSAEL